MKSLPTLSREIVKKSLLTLDYLFWLIFDFSKFKRIKKENIKNILIIHLGAIGELTVTTPILSTIKKELKANITFMINPGKEKLFMNNPNVDKIIHPAKNFKEQVAELKKHNFDLAIILYPGSFKWALTCFKAKIPYRIGCFAGVKGFPVILFNKRTFPFSNKNAILKNLDIIKQIDLNCENPRIEMYLSEKEKTNLKNKLKKLKIKDYAVIHPSFSSSMDNKYPSRLWPLDRYSKIADYLSSKYGLDVIITGNPSERSISQTIKNNCKQKNIIISNELFDLRDIMALLSDAKILVSCGTGIAHLGASFNTPAVVFEGKGDHIEWIPWYTDKTKLRFLFHPEVCTGCDREFCRKKSTECMDAITVDEVKNSIDAIMSKNKHQN
jgi:ADP-heptose:LPS heptosyltransferase